MPRDANGTYTLPLPPVTAATVIATTWANPTMDDIATALTDSLSRTGQGGMQAPFRQADGTAAQPSYSWTDETSSGDYRPSAGRITRSITGIDTMRWDADRVQSAVPLMTANGTKANPALSWSTETNAGWYQAGLGDYRFVTSGIDRLTLNPSLARLGDQATNNIKFDPSNGSIQARNNSTPRLLNLNNTFGAAHVALGEVGVAGIYIDKNDDDIIFYSHTTNIAQTVTAANGGLLLNNQATGSGFERVLTESDRTGGGVQVFDKSGAQSVFNTTYVGMIGLDGQVQMVTGENYYIELKVIIQINNGGLRVRLREPSGGSFTGSWSYTNSAGEVTTVENLSTVDPEIILTQAQLAADIMFKFEGNCICNGSSDLAVEFAQQTASGAPTTIATRGGFIRATRTT
jgi:uncharacterized protein (DUF779 family)